MSPICNELRREFQLKLFIHLFSGPCIIPTILVSEPKMRDQSRSDHGSQYERFESVDFAIQGRKL
jgi:hypothetical protein